MSYSRPASPYDPTNPTFSPKRQTGVNFADKEVATSTRSARSNSDSSQGSSNSNRRRARFAEATSVVSPAVGPGEKRGPFADPPTMASTNNQSDPAKPSDFGFGYIADNNPVEQHASVPLNMHAGGMPLKSALKSPGAAARFINPLSPTFKEEAMLEREEEKTEKQQAKDIKVKTRVRLAKVILRGVSFSCSLIVLAMLTTVLNIFRATRTLPPRNSSPAWAAGTSMWPQIVVLVIACISLLLAVIVLAAYCRPGGHRRAEKVGVYYTMFAVASFILSIVMWLIGAAVLQGTKANGNGTDLWGWACKDNKRRALFQDDVEYALICRLQDWSLICCIIEIIVEIMVISIYAVVFYRFYTKNKLRKSMNARDRARSDLYLAQLRSQSAPNTPGFAMTPRNASFPSRIETSDNKSAGATVYSRADEEDSPMQFATITPTSAHTASPFKLQAPPTRNGSTPRVNQDGFEQAPTPPVPQSSFALQQHTQHQERFNEHATAAPGETVYESVPIPGAYAGGQHH